MKWVWKREGMAHHPNRATSFVKRGCVMTWHGTAANRTRMNQDDFQSL